MVSLFKVGTNNSSHQLVFDGPSAGDKHFDQFLTKIVHVFESDRVDLLGGI